MALSFLYLMARRLAGMLLGSLRSEHAKDVEIAASDPGAVARVAELAERASAARSSSPSRNDEPAEAGPLLDGHGDDAVEVPTAHLRWTFRT